MATKWENPNALHHDGTPPSTTAIDSSSATIVFHNININSNDTTNNQKASKSRTSSDEGHGRKKGEGRSEGWALQSDEGHGSKTKEEREALRCRKIRLK